MEHLPRACRRSASSSSTMSSARSSVVRPPVPDEPVGVPRADAGPLGAEPLPAQAQPPVLPALPVFQGYEIPFRTRCRLPLTYPHPQSADGSRNAVWGPRAAEVRDGDDTSRCVQSSAYWLAAIEGDYASGWSFNRCRAGVYLLAYFKVSAVTGFASGSRASCDAGFSQTRQTGSAVLL